MPQPPTNPFLERAIASHQRGQLSEAESLYRQVLSRNPNDPEALHYLGVLAGQAGHHEAAIELIRRSLAIRPEQEARLNLANSLALYALALRSHQKAAESIPILQESIALDPDNPDTHVQLALALRECKQLEQAIEAMRRAVELNPRSPEAHNNLANFLQEAGDLGGAINALRHAISLRPDYAEALSNLGNAMREQGQIDESLAVLHQVIALRPQVPQIHNNLANVLRAAGQQAQAIEHYRRAVTLETRYAQGWNNLGVALREAGQIDQAIDAHRRAISIEPEMADAHFALAFSLLLSGRFQEGWREYEWRLKRRSHASVLRRNWEGSGLNNQTILLHAEQGFGDTIQFARYAQLVSHRGGRIILGCQRELARLLQRLPGVASVIAIDDPLPGFHLHCPLMSLPLVFGTDVHSIPANVPYLSADSALASQWEKRIPSGRKLNVGLCWSGRPTHPDDRNRSIPVELLFPLAELPNVRFHSLQPGAATEISPRIAILDHTQHLTDFADTAALIANLDLVITVDTAVAHLAGAMAKPAWLLLPFAPDWRWMLGRDDSPWYPTMRLFRQPAPRDWPSVVANVLRQLREARAI
jgi:tetratricopeptide (TPR) repeat protein